MGQTPAVDGRTGGTEQQEIGEIEQDGRQQLGVTPLAGVDPGQRHHQNSEHQDGEGQRQTPLQLGHQLIVLGTQQRDGRLGRRLAVGALHLLLTDHQAVFAELGDLELLAGELALVAGAILQGQPLQAVAVGRHLSLVGHHH